MTVSDVGDNAPELVIISGMSGAGRSTAAKCLEDLGWFVVDNLPPALIPTMVDLGARSQGSVRRIGAVVDVRGRSFFDDLLTSLEELEKRYILRVLEAQQGNKAAAARTLGIERKTLYRKLEIWGVTGKDA